MSLWESIRRWWPALVLVLFFLILGGGYAAGYRLGPGLALERLSTLTITDLPQGTTLYLDEKAQKVPAQGALMLRVLPRDHSILALADGYWPWVAIISVPQGGLMARSLLIPRSPTVTILAGSARTAAARALSATKLPPETAPLTLPESCIRLYVANNAVIGEPSEGCTPPPFLCDDSSCGPTIILSSTEKIASVLPYPGRTDALLVVAGSHVYGLALDPRTPRALAPVLTGNAPQIAALGDGTVVGKDGSTIFSLTLP